MPALEYKLSANTDDFKKKMSDAGNHASIVTKAIALQVIKMNASFLASQGAAGAATLAFGRVLGILGPIALGITAVSDAFKLASYSIELAKERIAEFNALADKANDAGVGTDFFQRMAKSGAAARLSIDDVSAALKRFNEATLDQLGGGEMQKQLAEMIKNGNFAGNGGVIAFNSASTSEQKFRAVVQLIEEAMEKGQRLAALDLAGTVFGPKVAAALRDDAGYLDQMLKRADAMAKTDLISQESIGRAIDLKERMEAAEKILSDKWKPVQDDLARLGTNYHENWVSITETIAAAVGYATQLYQALGNVPDWFAKRLGNASIWKDILDATTTAEGRAASEQSLGISSNPADIAQIAANAQLRAALQNHATQTRQMREATDIQSAVRGDTSKAPPKPDNSTAQTRDRFDTSADQISRRTAALQAEAGALDLSSEARARAQIAAQLETVAKQANAQAGLGANVVTDAQRQKIDQLADAYGKATAAMEKARVGSAIKFGASTALLSQDDVRIAQQLKGLYPDISTALNSVEANALRVNDAMRSISSAMETGLVDGLTDITTGAKSVGDAFNDMSRVVIRAIEQAIIKLLIVEPLMKALSGGMGGGMGGLFGFADGGEVKKYADGGVITGRGGPRSDSIVARVSPGEYIVNASATAQHRDLLHAINSGTMPRFADGGPVGGSSAPLALGGNAMTIAPAITVNVSGGSQGPHADAAMGKTVAQAVEKAVRQIAMKEIRSQMRPGGTLSR